MHAYPFILCLSKDMENILPVYNLEHSLLCFGLNPSVIPTFCWYTQQLKCWWGNIDGEEHTVGSCYLRSSRDTYKIAKTWCNQNVISSRTEIIRLSIAINSSVLLNLWYWNILLCSGLVKHQLSMCSNWHYVAFVHIKELEFCRIFNAITHIHVEMLFNQNATIAPSNISLKLYQIKSLSLWFLWSYTSFLINKLWSNTYCCMS